MNVSTQELAPVLPPMTKHERRRHNRWNRRWNKGEPQTPMTREEIAYEEARRAVKRRVSFFSHAVVYGMVTLFLIVTAGFESAIVVALAWGIGLASHGYSAVIAPGLSKRWLEEEYRLRLGPSTEMARRQIEGRHSKNLETLSASLAHEIRNPITAAKSLVQQMGEDPAATENVEYARVALDELDRVERSIAHLLRYAREEDIKPEVMVLSDVVNSAVETFTDRIARSGIDVEEAVEDTTRMRGDPEQLRRVVINLVGNAMDELEESSVSSPRITITGGCNLAGTEVWMKVKDNGPGIEAERLNLVFSPFHTSKEGGTGLGLAITKKIVEGHQGTIEVRSTKNEGTEFEVFFPRAPGENA